MDFLRLNPIKDLFEKFKEFRYQVENSHFRKMS
jgi:hypothetical protein